LLEVIQKFLSYLVAGHIYLFNRRNCTNCSAFDCVSRVNFILREKGNTVKLPD
jgi:hypothetical protein